MALSISTGLRNGILDASALNALLDTGEIRIFSGSAPADADAAQSGTLLVTINTSSGSGFDLKFQLTAAAGVLSKQTNTWDGVAVDDGVAGYFRYCADKTDPGTATTTEIRIQGAISTSGAELNMSNTSITNAATTTIDTFDITMPAA